MLQSLLSRFNTVAPLGAAILFLLGGLGLLISSDSFSNKKFKFYAVFSLSVGVFIALCFCFYKYTVDDAYICLRFARNLANGYGLVFSTDGSAPVEGYTNFLWVLMEAPLFLLKLTDNIILHLIKLIGIVFGIGVIISSYFLMRLLTGNIRISLLGALFLSAIPQLSFWAIGGLETTMYLFWLVIGLYRYITEQRNDKAHIWSMVFFVLMALTRPEGLFFVAGILLWELAQNFLAGDANGKTRIMRIVPGIVIFALLYGIYFLWRYNFYGFLLPNTFYAKVASFNGGQMLLRFIEMRPFIAYLLPMVSLAWFGYFQLHQSSNREKKLLLVTLALLFAFCFVPKREWMPGFRYELPFVPILVLFSSVGIHQILFDNWKNILPRRKTYITRLGILFFIGIFLLSPAVSLGRNKHSTDDLNFAHVALGKWLKHYAPEGSSYAGWDMGAVPYYSELPFIIDIHDVEGLLSTYITHKGYDVNYFLSLTPSFIVLPIKPAPGNNIGIYAFYSNGEFKKDYQFLFSFAFRRGYELNVYKHHKVYIPQHALDEGKILAERSVAESYK